MHFSQNFSKVSIYPLFKANTFASFSLFSITLSIISFIVLNEISFTTPLFSCNFLCRSRIVLSAKYLYCSLDHPSTVPLYFSTNPTISSNIFVASKYFKPVSYSYIVTSLLILGTANLFNK